MSAAAPSRGDQISSSIHITFRKSIKASFPAVAKCSVSKVVLVSVPGAAYSSLMSIKIGDEIYFIVIAEVISTLAESS